MRILFITGTDTGVGKTALTALMLSHLRQTGCHALALKPFCSGSRADAKLLHALQDGELTMDEVNAFHFAEPVAPLVASRIHRRRKITLEDILRQIQSIASSITPPLHYSTPPLHLPFLLIEGSGGLLVPLGEGFTVLDFIVQLAASPWWHRSTVEVLVVARNKLGTINHTLLTVRALQNAQRAAGRGVRLALKVILMSSRKADSSAASNPRVLSELLHPVPLLTLPFLAGGLQSAAAVRTQAARLKDALASMLDNKRGDRTSGTLRRRP